MRTTGDLLADLRARAQRIEDARLPEVPMGEAVRADLLAATWKRMLSIARLAALVCRREAT